MESHERKIAANSLTKHLLYSLLFLRRFRGYIAAFTASCAYACMAILIASLANEMESLTLTFARAFVSSFVGLIAMSQEGTDIRIKSMVEFKFHLLNAVLVAASMACQIYAYHHMPTADASAIVYGYVAFTGMYGRIFLKESLGIFGVVMVILTFGGIILIVRPPFLFQIIETGTFETNTGSLIFPAIVAVAATQAIALHIIALRAMGKQNIPIMKTMFYAMTGTMVILVVPISVLHQWFIPNCIWGRIRMVLAATSGVVGYFCMGYALSVENAIYVSLVVLNDVLIVFLISITFMSFKPSLWSVVGMFFIMGSSVLILVRKMKTSRKEAEKSPLPAQDFNSLRCAELEPLNDALIIKVTSV